MENTQSWRGHRRIIIDTRPFAYSSVLSVYLPDFNTQSASSYCQFAPPTKA